MTVLPASVIATIMAGNSVPRSQLSLSGVVLRKTPPWSKKPMTISKVPYTAIRPTKGQMEVRIHFGRLGKEAKRLGEINTEGYPGSAGYIKRKMKGFVAPHSMRPEDYPSKKRRTFHTLEELEKMLGGETKVSTPVTVPF